ncbi:MAG: thioesterase family protein [Rhodobiaceae bacterium]|nr:thioesterase family protein [Rhodobiaceae bacterium]
MSELADKEGPAAGMAKNGDGMIETGRRFVNTWECDENRHMNVQFYFAHFEEADPHFWHASGLAGAGLAFSTRVRHARFHRELNAGDMPIVSSALAADESGGALLYHAMRRPDGTLMATCTNRLETDLATLRKAAPQAPVVELPEEARARSFPLAPDEARSVETLTAQGCAPTYRGLVRPADCGGDGDMTAQMHVARFTDAAGHFWDHIGLDREWIDAHGYGRVAIELKLTYLSKLTAGDPILVLSGMSEHGRKTVTFRHHTINVRTGEPAAICHVTGLSLDLASRRSVEWPEDKRAKFPQGHP